MNNNNNISIFEVSPFSLSEQSNPKNAARRNLLAGMYRAHGPFLVAYATRRLRDADAAQEVVQDAFASILTGQSRLPAVDVRRKLQQIVAYHCDLRIDAHGGERRTRHALREARAQAETAAWRAWRVARRSRLGPEDDDADRLDYQEDWR